MMKNYFILLFSLLISLTVHSTEIYFEHENNSLHGVYLEPSHKKKPKAVIIFVHGDGALNYNADGYYDLIWEPLRENGYAILSWSKPGVGKSEGNWLLQSMQDRQNEVLAAIDFVQKEYGFDNKNIGLLGFSQAGWVVPALASKTNKVGFTIGIGFAVNWIDQGRYYTETSIRLNKGTPEHLKQSIVNYDKGVRYLKEKHSYEKYLDKFQDDSISKERYQFIINNVKADASEDYRVIDIPALLLWGKDDLNVDALKELNWVQANTKDNVSTKLLKNATHGLLRADEFNQQAFDIWLWFKLMWQGEEAFAPDFMPVLLSWLNKQHN